MVGEPHENLESPCPRAPVQDAVPIDGLRAHIRSTAHEPFDHPYVAAGPETMWTSAVPPLACAVPSAIPRSAVVSTVSSVAP